MKAKPFSTTAVLYDTPGRAAARFGISRSTLNKLVKAGDLQAKKLGTRVLVDLGFATEYFANLPDARAERAMVKR